MTGTRKHLREFLQDAVPILEKLKNRVDICREQYPDREILDDIFRHLHSLKSGASFFQLTDIENHIHSMESLFEDMKRSPGGEEFRRKARRLFQGIPLLEELLEEGYSPAAVGQAEPGDREVPRPDPVREGHPIELSAFEQQLLREAERRGETLFRLSVQVDPEERLPYVRAYLILNNLELTTNVIHAYPPPDDPEQDFFHLTYILTSDGGDAPVFNAVNVDGILQTSLVRLDYSRFSTDGSGAQPVSETMVKETLAPVIRKVELETDTISRLKDSLVEMKEIVLPLPPGLPQREPLLGLIRDMEQNLNSVSLIPLSSLFPNLKRFIRESGERIGKQITGECRGGQFGLNVRTLEILSRILIQLIRNAVSHGIESPADRISAGKNPGGTITIDARSDGSAIRILFGDDGAGIDTDAVARKAGNREELAEPGGLLRILSRPGFSTTDSVDRLSGRGIGLDLVTHDVENALGGRMKLETVKGTGARFILTLPGERDLLPLMIFQMDGRLLALPKRNVAGVFPMESRRLEQKEHNLLHYRHGKTSIPLFSPTGMVSRRDSNLSTPYVIVIQHQGKKAVLPVDDLVMEKEIPRDLFFLGDQTEPFLYNVTVSGETADFLYLSPGLIG